VAAARTGVEQSQGDVIFVQDIHEPTRASDLKRLWRLKNGRSFLTADPLPPSGRTAVPRLTDRLVAWASGVRPHTPLGLQMIRRDAVRQWRRAHTPATERRTGVLHTDHGDAQRGPNFLTRVRDFALGE
jgi:hypothetical protein